MFAGYLSDLAAGSGSAGPRLTVENCSRKTCLSIVRINAMENDPTREPGTGARKTGKGMPTWFKLFALALVGLIISKVLGLQVFLEVTYDGIPFLARLTDVRTYFIPLFLILVYILIAWSWKQFFGTRDR